MKKNLKKMNFENAIEKEWVVTNGLGGFASSTILGANTRKYHGLLVAPFNAPGDRHLLVSKVDESIKVGGKTHILYTNMCRNNISQGYKNLVEFEKEEYPIFRYEVDGILIEKSICMEHGKNVTVVLYKIKNTDKKAVMRITPLLNYRNFHAASLNRKFNMKQKVENNLVDVQIDKETHHIFMNCSEGVYKKTEHDSFKNMFYYEEERRGLSDEENHAIAGYYEIEIDAKEEKIITFSCSLDDDSIQKKDGQKILEREKNRIKKLMDNSELSGDEELIKTYIIAADNFIVTRKNLRTIIAGYPWFLDWGRDNCVAFEGLVLKTKRFDVAKKILLTLVKDVKQGLVPNGYAENDDKALYNSVDSSLLLFEVVSRFLKYTNDYDFIKSKVYKKLKDIIEHYSNGVNLDDNNIFLDSDNLISAGTETTQNTWMDAKIGDYAVTPRNGKQVEINSMWYNALMVITELGKKFDEDKAIIAKYRKMAKLSKASFEKQFYNKDTKCLYDVIGDEKIRPNQLYALSLSHPVIDPSSEIAKNIFNVCTQKLLVDHGLKTLAKGYTHYTEVYDGNQYRRDISYHQGITWPWLIGIYNDAYLNLIGEEKDKNAKKDMKKEYKLFVEKLKKTYVKELNDGKTMGSIPELYDSKKPYSAKGAFAQSWSVSEVFRIICN